MGSTANNITTGENNRPGTPPADADDAGSEEEAWVFYKDREEWADVTPVKQDDGQNAVVKIAYTNDCECVK